MYGYLITVLMAAALASCAAPASAKVLEPGVYCDNERLEKELAVAEKTAEQGNLHAGLHQMRRIKDAISALQKMEKDEATLEQLAMAQRRFEAVVKEFSRLYGLSKTRPRKTLLIDPRCLRSPS